MSDLVLRFQAFGERSAFELLERVGELASDLRPAFAEILEDFEAEERELFSSGGAEAGGWAPLDPAYADWKRRHYGNASPLVRTGRLEAAATGQSDELQVVLEPMLLRAEITTPYAAFLVRQRAIVPFTEARRQRWTAIVDRHLARVATSAAAPAGA